MIRKSIYILLLILHASHSYAQNTSSDSSNYIIQVSQNNKWGLLDKFGKEITACQYDNIAKFSEGISTIKNNGNYI